MPHSSFRGNTFAVSVVECLVFLGEIMTEDECLLKNQHDNMGLRCASPVHKL